MDIGKVNLLLANVILWHTEDYGGLIAITTQRSLVQIRSPLYFIPLRLNRVKGFGLIEDTLGNWALFL